MDWIDLIQGRRRWREGSCEHGKEPPLPYNVANFLTSYGIVVISRRSLLHGFSQFKLVLESKSKYLLYFRDC